MKIAVDIGAHSARGHGISRYITELLPRMQRLAGPEVTWYLYGRERTGWDGLDAGRTVFRADGLPEHAGRIASLFGSLPAWAARDRPDIYWAPAHRFPCWLPRATRKVLTVHDLCWFKLPQAMRKVTYHLDRCLMPQSLRRADAVLAVSQSVAHDLRELAPDAAGKVSVVHEGAMRPAPCLGRDALAPWGVRGPYMLFVGVQEPRKNLRRLLQALAALEASGRLSADLLVVGAQGWGEVDLAAWIGQWGLGHRVRLLGQVDDGVLAALYRHTEFLVMPSLYEGFGLPLAECLSAGRPVLTSRLSSMPEVAGAAGYLVDPWSVDAMAEGIGHLLSSPALVAELAAQALVESRRFDWDRAASDTLAVLLAAAR